MDDTRERIRERRTGWAAGGKLAVTERDIRLLYVLGRCGILRTCDFVAYAFGSRATANDRLRKLFCHSLIDCHVASLGSDNLYSLTPAGRDVVVEALDVDPSELRVIRRIPKRIDHALGISSYRILLAKACEGSARYRLARFETDADLSAERHASMLELVPDGRIEIEDKTSGMTHVFHLEVDTGTEPTTYLGKKLGSYGKHAATRTPLFGTVGALVVFVTPSLRRARNIARTVSSLATPPAIAFTLPALLTATTILGSVYSVPADLVTTPPTDPLHVLFRRPLLP